MMRYCALFLLAGSSFAADFYTAEAARAVIGQTTFTAQDPTGSQSVVGGVSGLAYVNDTLFVADSNRVGASPVNNRILIFNNLSTQIPAADADVSYTRKCPVCGGLANVVLGQPDFTKTDIGLSQNQLRQPTAVASDGTILAVADTDNNRVLIWKSIPTANQQPADVVLGQPDFTTSKVVIPPTASTLRGPQGVWIQNGMLFVADTDNSRVLIWNSIPSSNGQAANLVLGQPDFTTQMPVDLTQGSFNPKANTLLNPVSVTSDGQRLYVTDLGYNRVLIWNTIPSSNQAPADVVVGQADMTSAVSNNVKALCTPTKDTSGNDIYPARCGATLNFPRYALSDGQRLFIADGGNDRVLVFKQVPAANGASADAVLGQLSDQLNSSSDSADPLRRSSADSLRTPLSLAYDGLNLYVSDVYNRRIMVFTQAEKAIPYTGVRNAASLQVFAVGAVTFSGTIQADDEATITIAGKDYKYKVIANDTFENIVNKFVALINAGDGDPNVFASPNTVFASVILTARQQGAPGNSITLAASVGSTAKLVVKTSSATLGGGQDAAKIAPGTLVSFLTDADVTDNAVAAPPGANPLPTKIDGVQVYFNGILAPLLYVSPRQINAQVPWQLLDQTSINAYVRKVWPDGHVTVTNPTAVPIIGQNPGLFTFGGTDPRPGVVLHYSSNATASILVSGTAKTGNTATVTIEDRPYTYTVKDGDTLNSIRDGLILLMGPDPKVEAFPGGSFTRIRLRAKVAGAAGNGIKYTTSVSSGATVILSPSGTALCCANTGGALVEDQNPAQPGETILVYGTGLGLITPDEALSALHTGFAYDGPTLNNPVEFVSSLAGGKTANVLYAGAKVGMVGVYEVQLELNSDLPTNPKTQCTIAQSVYVSNIITFPVANPTTP